MKKRGLIIIAFLTIFFSAINIFAATNHYTSAQIPGTWVQVNNEYYWRKNSGGNLTNAFLDYKNNTYYLANTGIMAKGWAKIDENWYYFRNWGGMYKNTFFEYDNNTYYVDASGIMAIGWKKINGNWYYFKSWGGMCKNEMITDNGYNYYLTSNGSMAVDKYTINGTQYYFLPSGESSRLQRVNQKKVLSFSDSNGVISVINVWGIIEEYVATNGKEWKTGDRKGYAYYNTSGNAYLTIKAWQPRHYNSSNDVLKTFGWSNVDSLYSSQWKSLFASRNLTATTYNISNKNTSRIVFVGGSADVIPATVADDVRVSLYY